MSERQLSPFQHQSAHRRHLGISCNVIMDAFSGYNQIRMGEEDEERTAFITGRGTYCYTVIPFGLKNAGATYQRMVNKVFRKQLDRNKEAYVDYKMVKGMSMM